MPPSVSAYTAVVFYAGARIISGFLTIALHSRFLTRLQLVREHHVLILYRLNLILIWIASAAWLWGVLLDPLHCAGHMGPGASHPHGQTQLRPDQPLSR